MAYPALSLWISEDFSRSALPVTLVLTLGIWINSVAMVPYTVLHAMGKPKVTALFHVIELTAYVVLLAMLTPKYGVLGAATAWVMRIALDLVLLEAAVRRILHGQ
jgi:O-antigen/teichoic acid export membrane protein